MFHTDCENGPLSYVVFKSFKQIKHLLIQVYNNKKMTQRACFPYKRGMEYSLFVLLIFLLRLDFKHGKMIKRNKECSIPRS